MGSVFQAEDTLDGRTVALKFMHATANTAGARRFMREARLLAELRHPGIVAHVAHGLTESGLPFLAMEWLEGEDLARRLARKPLSLEETMGLMRCVAEALSVAHERGIIHRDLKPSNLFLRQNQAEAVVILDFGLARHQLESQALTGSAMLLGTPRYMAPEQASSQKTLTPSADIFSLGCVLYECLTGQPPFEAPHLAAVLAKILFAEPLPLCHSKPELPPSLQVLVDRMLAKESHQRLPDAVGLLDVLVRLDGLADTVEPGQGTRTGGLTGAEQRLVSVLLVVPPQEKGEACLEQTLTLDPAAGSLRGALLEHLHKSIPGQGGRVVMLADGSLLLTLLPERDTASDQVLLAARCALSIQERWPQVSIVLSTGRGQLGSQQPVGEVMDRAGRLLRQGEQLPASSPAHLLLDEVTAGLLGPGFELARLTSGVYQLRGEQLDADASRLLLGRPTTCVGREQELAMLELAFGSCVEDSSARALLVLASAGMGKSRLRHEFLRRLEKRGQQVLLMLGRGEPMRAGSAYGLLGQAVRRLCGIQDTAALEPGREKLRQRVGMHLPAGEERAVVEFLGELCGIPFPEENSPGLRTARADPRAMSAQVGRALVSFLRAECSRGPVLLVLEDLHWGDARSVQLMGEALRALSEQPLLVLALARPEVKELFPGLWGNPFQEVALRGLSRKAGGRLVREVLGAEVSESVIERMVEQAAGNALFLEELIRMAADGRGEEPPVTVLAMLQGRMQRLAPGVRQVLLAASFFGRTFWSGGVRALLDSRDSPEVLEQRIRQLVELEVVEQLPESRFPSEVEYRFRHALVRDAAQGLVLDDHKPTGHLRVGAWLEQMGEPDPLVLAEHYQLGHVPERAIPLYIRAAEQLLERYDCQATLRCVEAGLACGAGGAMRTRLRALQALVFVWMDDLRQAYDIGSAVLPELKPGSLTWCRLAGPLLMSSFYVGRLEEGVRTAQLLLHTQPEPDAVPAYLESLFFPVSNLGAAGMRQQAAAFLARMVEVGATQVDVDVHIRAWVCNARGCFGLYFEDTLWQSFFQAERAASLFHELGLGRDQIVAQTTAAMARSFLGDVAGAVELLRGVLDSARQAGEPFTISYVQVHLALMLAWSPEEKHRDAAHVLALDWLKEHAAAPNPITKGVAYTALAKVALARGALQEAEDWAGGASALLSSYLTYRLLAHLVLSESLLTRGQLARAREVLGEGDLEWERLESGGFAAIRRLGVLAEVCFAQGDTEAGESALKRALRYLRKSAEDLPEPAFRERLLHQVPENARVLKLARLRWGEAWSMDWWKSLA